MGERALLEAVTEYLVNCAWQIPLLAAGAWLLVKAVRPGVLVQHWIWLSVLAMAVVLPLRGIELSLAGVSASVRAEAVPVVATPEHGRVAEDIAVGRGVLRAQDAKPVTSAAKQRVALPLAGRSLVLNVAATRWLVGFYMLAIFLGGLRLARGLLAVRGLVQRSREAVLAPRTMRVLEEACRSLRVAMPRMRESGESDGPVIVRALRPVMVLPCGFEEHAEEEVRAALLHELAHVRRRDYLVNLVCQIVALPVAWHPVVYGIEQRIRSTREMLCDAIAAEQMGSGAEYARCLVSLARQMVHGAAFGTQAVGLFERNTMEERVMKLTEDLVETKAVMSGRARVLRGLCGFVAMLAVTGAAAMFHVRPAFAAAEAVVQSAAAAAPASASAAAAAKAKPSAQVAAPAPAPDAAPLAVARGDHAKVTAGKDDFVHRWKSANGEPFTTVNRDAREPSAEDRRRIEREFAESKKEADEALRWTNGPEFQAQMTKLQERLANAQIKVQVEAANRIANDPAMKQRMAELQRSLARIDAMPELKRFNDPEWQKQFAELAKNPPSFNFKFDPSFDFNFDKQMALANSQLDEAKLNETIANAMKGNEEQMAKLQKEMESGELQRKLDEATRLLEEVRKGMEAKQTK